MPITRDAYKRRIWTYKKRRSILKGKCHSLSMKIRQWEACLRERGRAEKRIKAKIAVLAKKVNEYFEVDIKNRLRQNNHTLARNIYYKVGLENKIPGSYLSKFIGRSKRTALIGRKELLKSFKHNKKNTEAYHRFKQYFEN